MRVTERSWWHWPLASRLGAIAVACVSLAWGAWSCPLWAQAPPVACAWTEIWCGGKRVVEARPPGVQAQSPLSPGQPSNQTPNSASHETYRNPTADDRPSQRARPRAEPPAAEVYSEFVSRILRDARRRAAEGDLPGAVRLAELAEESRAAWGFVDDSPLALLRELRSAPGAPPAANPWRLVVPETSVLPPVNGASVYVPYDPQSLPNLGIALGGNEPVRLGPPPMVAGPGTAPPIPNAAFPAPERAATAPTPPVAAPAANAPPPAVASPQKAAGPQAEPDGRKPLPQAQPVLAAAPVTAAPVAPRPAPNRPQWPTIDSAGLATTLTVTIAFLALLLFSLLVLVILLLVAVRRLAAKGGTIFRVEVVNGQLSFLRGGSDAERGDSVSAAGADSRSERIAGLPGCDGVPFPFAAPGPTFDEQRRQEEDHMRQREEAIMKQVLAENLLLRESIAECRGVAA